MSADSGPGRGGTALFVSPGRMQRGVAFAPAVRGYPGGIADMAGELDEYVADLSFGDDEWEPTAAPEPEAEVPEAAPEPAEAGSPASGQATPGQQVPGQQAPDQQVPGQQAPAQSAAAQSEAAQPVSVWQQSAAAWQEAGIDWLLPARAEPRTARPVIADDDPRTEPIPVLSADGSPRAPRTGELARRPPADQPGAGRPAAGLTESTAGGVAEEAGTPGAAGAGVAQVAEANGSAAETGARSTVQAGAAPADEGVPDAAGPGPVTAAPGPAAGLATDVGAPDVAGPAAAAAVEPGVPVADAGAGSAAGAGAATADGGVRDAAGPGAAAMDAGAGHTGAAAGTGTAAGTRAAAGVTGGTTRTGGRTRRGRRITVVAVVALVLVAGTLAGIGIAGRGGGPAEPGFTLVTPYPAAVPADAELAGRTAGTTPVLASLTGIAAAGKTIVAIGAAPSQPGPAPLILFSADGGHTWARAALTGGGPGAGPGGGPGAGPGPAGSGLAAGPGGGLGAGPGAAAAPGAGTVPVLITRSGGNWLALGQHAAWVSPDGRTWRPAPGLPPVAGDTVLGLAGTGSGFVAVGAHTGSHPGPVVWTSSSGGRPWQRRSGAALGLAVRSGHVTALRWAAGQGGVVVAGGLIGGAGRQGRRPDAGLWRSADGGLTWTPVTLPATHGATGGLAGLAANGSAFVAVRPGRTAGRQDAVTYLSAQGSTWHYAGKLTPVRRTSLQVITVSGSSHGFVASGSAHSGQVAFFSAHGHGWHQTTYPGTGVAGLIAGPGGTVLAAGNSPAGSGAGAFRPHLLLTGPAGRQQVAQAVLAAAATPDATVNGLAASGRTLVAAGASGGSPALWLGTAGQGTSGQWAPAGVLLPVAWRNGALVSVAHGARGWLAVGQASPPGPIAPAAGLRPASSQPVILASATGTSWVPASGTGPLTAPGTSLAQAAAGPAGYVVVGSAPARAPASGGSVGGGATGGGTSAAAAWYSANLGTWARVPLPGPGTGAGGTSQVLAVTATGHGFAAAGVAGGSPAVWTTRNGTSWAFTALPRPAGATGAVLAKITANGGRLVATGYYFRAGPALGGIPFAAVSTDGGRTWQESALPAPPVPAVVTALAAAGHGFVAVGHSGVAAAGGRTGVPGRRVMLAWWSSDGLTWQDGVPSGSGRGGPFVIQLNAVTAASGTLTGAGFAASGAAEHPLLWHARYR